MKYVIGLDYGSDSARAVLVNAADGEILHSSVKYYPRWMKGLYCNPSINQWRQHPLDYIEVLEALIDDILQQAGPGVAESVAGMAFDTTGSTPVFVDENARPLALLPEFAENPDAMFVLWKDHTAVSEAEEITEKCHRNTIDYTKYVGGIYSAEWFWAKAMHILREDESVARRAYSIVECCEWLPALLTGVDDTDKIVRSRCACGHKVLWNERWGGIPDKAFLESLEPMLGKFHSKSFRHPQTADKPAGRISGEWADRLGLNPDVVIAGGAYDCHMGAVGAGIEPKVLVRVIGTSTCDIMVSSYDEIGDRQIRGICGQVDGSVIPGMMGLEAGQSSFGDVYAMFSRILDYPLRSILPEFLDGKLSEAEITDVVSKTSGNIIKSLSADASEIPVDENPLVATDWVNGRRTPDADQSLKGAVAGLTLGTTAPMVFKAFVEATAFGTMAIVDRFVNEGCEIDSIIGIGGIALKNPYVMQTMSDVVNLPIKVCNTDQACALGAAMFAATAAGLYDKVEDAIKAMNSGYSKEYLPDPARHEIYQTLYARYSELGRFTESHKF